MMMHHQQPGPRGYGGGGGAARTMTKDECERNLIVNYLPLSYDENKMQSLFSGYGRVEKVKLITDPQTGHSKCYGFVMYAEPRDAAAAVQVLCGRDIEGKKLRVAYAQPYQVMGGPSPSINVFFSGFGPTYTDSQIRSLASNYGEVLEAKVLDPQKHPRGVAFARFRTVAQAELCVRSLDKTELPLSLGGGGGGTFTMTARYAERKSNKPMQQQQQQQQHQQHQPPPQHSHHHMHHHLQHMGGGGAPGMRRPPMHHNMHNPMLGGFSGHGHMQGMGGGMGMGGGASLGYGPTSGGAAVFVHGLVGSSEPEISQKVYSVFSCVGKIQKVDIPKHPTGEPRNYCFVHFADMASAQAALQFDSAAYEGRSLQVRYKQF
ncbi:Protein elav [Diplonema papillatum]|nr:Protein elav [Diplonema papillatum]